MLGVSYVVSYIALFVLFVALQPENKRQIVEALVPLESDLKEKNYTAYMKCEVYRFTKNEEEWKERQNKRHKTRVRTAGQLTYHHLFFIYNIYIYIILYIL